MTMLKESNWNKSWAWIGDLDNEESHVTGIYTATMEDGLHYAVVRWYYGSSCVLVELLNGEIIYGGDL